MRGSSRISTVVRLASIVVVFALVLVTPLAAFAEESMEDTATFASHTNPSKGADATWRYNWGNTMKPDMIVTKIPADGTEDSEPIPGLQTLGFVYDFHQLGPYWFTFPEFGISSLSPRPEGTTISGTFDVAAVLAREGWTPTVGTTTMGEGIYGLSFCFYNQYRQSPRLWTAHFGVDVTRPDPVENLTSTAGALGATTQYTEASWRDLRWTPKAYDALSGVGGFKVRVNGEQVAFAQNVSPDPAYEPYADFMGWGAPGLPQLSNVTVEDLPAGESTIEIIVVDRATNESTAKSVKAYVDNDTPEIDITSPKWWGQRVPASPTFTVNTTDTCGIAKVKYYVDGVYVGSSSTKPYSFKANLSSFSSGTHTLKAVAEDRLAGVAGLFKPHTASDSIDFVLDKTAPTISYLSGAPNPFFPRKRDGYKDNFKVKFKSSESGTAKLKIYNSSGKLVRTVSKTIPAGSNSITWNGKRSTGSVIAGTYKWKLAVTDAAGNTRTTTARKVTIKFYEIVRVSSSSVRIIAR